METKLQFERRPSRRKLVAAVALAGGALVVTLAMGTAAYGWFGRHHGRGQWFADPAEAKEHAQFAAEWVLRKLDATDQQKEKVNAVVGRLVDELAPLAVQHRENREAWIAAFTQESVDRAALEKLRQSELELASAASSDLIEAFADIGTVLTPEQRRELLEQLQKHRRHGHD